MGAIVGIGIAAAIVFLVLGAALVAWGVLGALVLMGALLLGVAWMVDRRRQSQYDQP